MTAFTIRRATPDDAPAITGLRRLMFEAMGHRDDAKLAAMEGQFLVWVQEKTARGEFLTWLMVDELGAAVAAASLWIRESVPSPDNLSGREGLVLNVSTHPDYRRRGFARQLLEALLAWCRERNLRTLMLFATPEGKELYASLGFEATDFMALRLGE
jgi:GNAT superfamily N-acetyltransferase